MSKVQREREIGKGIESERVRLKDNKERKR